MKEASPPGARPGRALKRSDLFSEAWGSYLPSSAPHCLETPPPAGGQGEEEGRVEEEMEKESEDHEAGTGEIRKMAALGGNGDEGRQLSHGEVKTKQTQDKKVHKSKIFDCHLASLG